MTVDSDLDDSRKLLVISDEANMLGALHERNESDGLPDKRSAPRMDGVHS